MWALSMTNLFLFFSLLHQICAFMVIRESSVGSGLPFHSLYCTMDIGNRFQLSAASDDNEVVKEQPKDADEGEMTQELLMKRLGMDEVSQPGFDAEMLPLPLFTSLVIFIGSTILTVYGIYVGIFGFPVESP